MSQSNQQQQQQQGIKRRRFDNENDDDALKRCNQLLKEAEEKLANLQTHTPSDLTQKVADLSEALSRVQQEKTTMLSDLEKVIMDPVLLTPMQNPIIAPDGTSIDRSVANRIRGSGNTVQMPTTRNVYNVSQLYPNRSLQDVTTVYSRYQNKVTTSPDEVANVNDVIQGTTYDIDLTDPNFIDEIVFEITENPTPSMFDREVRHYDNREFARRVYERLPTDLQQQYLNSYREIMWGNL